MQDIILELNQLKDVTFIPLNSENRKSLQFLRQEDPICLVMT
jgi:hypothetical protein